MALHWLGSASSSLNDVNGISVRPHELLAGEGKDVLVLAVHPVWAHQWAHFEEQRNKNNFLSVRLPSQNASTSANACQSCLEVSTAVYQPVQLTFTFSPPMPDRA